MSRGPTPYDYAHLLANREALDYDSPPRMSQDTCECSICANRSTTYSVSDEYETDSGGPNSVMTDDDMTGDYTTGGYTTGDYTMGDYTIDDDSNDDDATDDDATTLYSSTATVRPREHSLPPVFPHPSLPRREETRLPPFYVGDPFIPRPVPRPIEGHEEHEDLYARAQTPQASEAAQDEHAAHPTTVVTEEDLEDALTRFWDDPANADFKNFFAGAAYTGETASPSGTMRGQGMWIQDSDDKAWYYWSQDEDGLQFPESFARGEPLPWPQWLISPDEMAGRLAMSDEDLERIGSLLECFEEHGGFGYI
ncbi:uncharacterized protein BXZ73DRAFT_75324 [Epithele typhae]|uniref:uncharacterized protein n=1 Tax=Epithele typhae TaxID=378194 RepID=UPI0020072C53|nr:uncharacterized protein BXZ73DRAFT_75324 [Epithele typhae]KAH9940778.1 hypothetical protein BXZ73DRAFT_75324 [Epithele typhae]